jgi:hypothetical protein
VKCVGAGLIYPSSPQKVVTPAGFVMGQSVDRLRQVYGQRAKYVLHLRLPRAACTTALGTS